MHYMCQVVFWIALFRRARWSQGTLRSGEYIVAERSQKHQAIGRLDSRQKPPIGGHELEQISEVQYVSTICNTGCECGTLDHTGGARVVCKQCEALAPDFGAEGFVQYPSSRHRVGRPHSRPQPRVITSQSGKAERTTC